MDEWSEIEQELRHCLQHVPAPEGFTGRVMARVEDRERARTGRASKGSRMSAGTASHAGWWVAVAAALALAVGGGDVLHLRHLRQQREAAAVQAQLDLAMQMTNHALNEVGVGLDRSPIGRFTQMLNATQK